MARLEVKIDGNASGLTKAFDQSAAGAHKFNTAMNSVSATTTKGLGNASGMAMEFGRVVQDLPYALNNFGSIGNNITRITEQFGDLRRQTGSVSTAFKSLGTSLVSTGSLISLAFSAVITGWTLWQQHSQKVAKATKDLEDGTKTYIETLEGLKRASADGQNNAQKDLVNLKLLYDATQSLTIPMEKRKKAAEELIKQYPKQFEGLTTEAVLAGKASVAYDKLTNSITATAMAAAYANKMTENAQKQLNNYLQIVDKQNAANKLSLDIEREKAKQVKQMAAGSAGTGASGAAQANVGAIYEQKRADILKEINNLGAQNSKITDENKLLQQNYNSQIAIGADASGRVTTNLEKTKQATKDSLDLLSLQGLLMSELDRKVFEVNNKYNEIFKTIGNITDRSKQADAFGLATQAKQAELLRLEVEKILYLTQGITGAKVNSPTATITNVTELPGLNSANTRINKAKNSDLNKQWEKTVEDMQKQFGRATSAFGRDMIRTLSTINQQADISFTATISNLTNSFIGGINSVIQEGLFKSLEKFFSNSMKDLGKTGTAISGGLGIAGSIVSGSTKRTSSIGQAAGGALSGAAAGMMFGPYGAAVGAVVGAVAGLLSASSAKKAEKIQEQQLAEQRKQTAIMERQSALAFTSAINGQMTVNGLITNMDRNAKGELVTKVSGKDLVLVIQRNTNNR